jgi:hypothetical protein
MKSIEDHIKFNQKKIDDPLISSQSRRHYEEELGELEKYKEKHPEITTDPTSLELFCDSNPHAPECKIYES